MRSRSRSLTLTMLAAAVVLNLVGFLEPAAGMPIVPDSGDHLKTVLLRDASPNLPAPPTLLLVVFGSQSTFSFLSRNQRLPTAS
jgi:hypothetical protein